MPYGRGARRSVPSRPNARRGLKYSFGWKARSVKDEYSFCEVLTLNKAKLAMVNLKGSSRIFGTIFQNPLLCDFVNHL
jgi:hypothetical protein